MTDERDPKLQSAYRALGAEEPPRALDEAILAAARRSAQPWTQRWAVPLSLAAVVVLSVTVTLRIQHEQPGIEQPAPAREEARVARQAAEPVKPATESGKPAAGAATPLPQQKSMTRKEAVAFPDSSQDRAAADYRAKAEENRAKETAPVPAPLAEMQSDTSALAKRADARSEVGSSAGSVAAPSAPAAAAPAKLAMQRDRRAAELAAGERPALTPEQELERIANLRKEQKHDEADKALAEFRKRYPEFKIPAAMLERIERR